MKTRCLLFSVLIFAATASNNSFGMKKKITYKSFEPTTCSFLIENKSGKYVTIAFKEISLIKENRFLKEKKTNSGKNVTKKFYVEKNLEPNSPKNGTMSRRALIEYGIRIVLRKKYQFQFSDEDKKQPSHSKNKCIMNSLKYKLQNGVNRVLIIYNEKEKKIEMRKKYS